MFFVANLGTELQILLQILTKSASTCVFAINHIAKLTKTPKPQLFCENFVYTYAYVPVCRFLHKVTILPASVMKGVWVENPFSGPNH